MLIVTHSARARSGRFVRSVDLTSSLSVLSNAPLRSAA